MKRFFIILSILASSVILPAHAASDVQAVITSVSTQWLTRASNLTVVINVTTSTFHDNISIETSVSNSPLVGRSQIQQALKDQLNSGFRNISTDAASNIDAGSHDFEIFLSRSQLSLTSSGAYVLSFSIKAGDEKTSLNLVMPYTANAATRNPLNLVVLWPISSSPVLKADRTPLSDENPFAEGSSLDALVQGSGFGVTWLKDADTISSAEALGNNDWLDALAAKTLNAEVFNIPASDADLSGLLQAKLDTVAETATSNNEHRLLFAPKSGDASKAAMQFVESRGGLIAVSDKCYPSTTSIYTPSSLYQVAPSQNKYLVIDSQASELLSKAISQNQDSLTYQQALFSDVLITQLERPNSTRVLAMKPNLGSAAAQIANVERTLVGLSNSWLKLIPTSQALQLEAGSRRHENCTVRSLSKTVVNQLKASERARLRMKTYIAGTAEEARLLAAMARVTSMNITSDSRSILREDLTQYTAFIYNSIRILSSGAVVFPQEQGKVPITIQNALSVPVKVLIEATGEPSVRVIPQPVQLIEIPAGKRKSIEISTRLVGSDIGFLKLQLTDEAGKPIGTAKRIQLSSAAYAGIARWVLIGAALALVLLLARNFYRRFSRTSRKNADL